MFSGGCVRGFHRRKLNRKAAILGRENLRRNRPGSARCFTIRRERSTDGARRTQIEKHAPGADRTIAARRAWLNAFNDVLGDSAGEDYSTFTQTVEANANGRPTIVDFSSKAISARTDRARSRFPNSTDDAGPERP